MQISFALLMHDPGALLRRLPILCLEDIGLLHPRLPLINWLMARAPSLNLALFRR